MIRRVRAGLAALWMAALPGAAVPADAPTSPWQDPVPALPADKAARHRLLDIAGDGAMRIAVGQHGVILTSVDHGRHWQQEPVPTSAMLTRVRLRADGSAWVLGHDASVLTRDAQGRWLLRHRDPGRRALYDLHFFDDRHGIAVGGFGLLLRTRDGGATWQVEEQGVLHELGMHLNGLVPLDDGQLLVVGERGLMAISADAGQQWQLLDSPYAGTWFGGLSLPQGGVLVYGMRGNLYRAADVAGVAQVAAADWDPYARQTAEDPQALGWTRIDNPVQESLFGADGLADGGHVLVGVNGSVLRLDAQATTVTTIPALVAEPLSGVLATPAGVVAVGRRGLSDLGILP